jgi:hypothetical protein
MAGTWEADEPLSHPRDQLHGSGPLVNIPKSHISATPTTSIDKARQHTDRLQGIQTKGKDAPGRPHATLPTLAGGQTGAPE